LELSGNAARDNKRLRIIPRHLMLAIKQDFELGSLFKNAILPGAGILPFIPIALLPDDEVEEMYSRNNNNLSENVNKDGDISNEDDVGNEGFLNKKEQDVSDEEIDKTKDMESKNLFGSSNTPNFQFGTSTGGFNFGTNSATGFSFGSNTGGGFGATSTNTPNFQFGTSTGGFGTNTGGFSNSNATGFSFGTNPGGFSNSKPPTRRSQRKK